MNPSTNRQKSYIHTLERKMAIDRDTYEAVIASVCPGKTSSTQLNSLQASAVIRRMEKLLGIENKNYTVRKTARKSRRPPLPKNVVRMASAQQKAKYAAMKILLKWTDGAKLDKWLIRQIGTPTVKTAEQAHKAIEGMKKVFERNMAKAYGPDWKQGVYQDDNINMYIRLHGGME